MSKSEYGFTKNQTGEDRRITPVDSSKIEKLSAAKLSIDELLYEADQLLYQANGRPADPTYSGTEIYTFLRSYPRNRALTQDVLEVIKNKIASLEFFGLTR